MVDIWSLGTLCYEMVVGHSPFSGSSMNELYQRVKKGNYILPNTLSEEVVSFINDMLQQNPDLRATASQLLNHKFIIYQTNTFHPVDVRSIQASYLPGGLINMKSKQPEVNNNRIILWDIFLQPGLFNGVITNPMPINVQPQIQPQMQLPPRPQMQIPNAGLPQKQMMYQQQPQNNFYSNPQVKYGGYP